jgi:hypothetical protein
MNKRRKRPLLARGQKYFLNHVKIIRERGREFCDNCSIEFMLKSLVMGCKKKLRDVINVRLLEDT